MQFKITYNLLQQSLNLINLYMQKLVIISNLIFFLIVSFLYENLHKGHDHDHIEVKCKECVIIDCSSDFLDEKEEVTFILTSIKKNEFAENYFFIYKIDEKVSSRAPPLFISSLI